MLTGLKNRIYKLKRNSQKIIDMSNSAKSLSHTVNHDDVTFEEAFQSLSNYNAFQPSQKQSEIKYLFEKVKADQPKVICEIGSYKGGTLFLFSQAAASDALIISIDIQYPIARKLAHKHLIKKGQKLVCIEGDTQDPKTLSRVMKVLRGSNIDFLFIDGDHSLFGVMNDYVRYSPLVKKSGLVVLHDIQPVNNENPKVSSAQDVGGVPVFWKMLQDSGLRTTEMVENASQNGFGLGVIYKELVR